MIFAMAVVVERSLCQAIQFELIVRLDEPLVEYKADHHANGERAPAKSESKYFVGFGLIIPADELVDVDDVTFQSVAKRAAKHRERFELRSAYAIVIKSHLIRIGQIKRLEDEFTSLSRNRAGSFLICCCCGAG